MAFVVVVVVVVVAVVVAAAAVVFPITFNTRLITVAPPAQAPPPPSACAPPPPPRRHKGAMLVIGMSALIALLALEQASARVRQLGRRHLSPEHTSIHVPSAGVTLPGSQELGAREGVFARQACVSEPGRTHSVARLGCTRKR
eukprot:5644478-Pleurochrysis_carterae.AAC.1